MRRIVLCLALISATFGMAGSAGAADPRTFSLSMRTIGEGVPDPTAFAFPNDGTRRIFVTEQAGGVRVRLYGIGLQSTPYLDIRDRVTSGGEQGLLGLAFHPRFTSNGYVFVAYTVSNGDLHISRFTASKSSQNTISKVTETLFLSIPHPTYTNHNGGQLQFGPDGYLYIGTGDGGGAGGPGGKSVNLGSLNGKILRIDVDHACEGHRYCSPSTNPYRNYSNRRHEIWEWGLRNPWRFSFDRSTGGLWVADVGQGSREELDAISSGKSALNLGWDCFEGTLDVSSQYGGAYCDPSSFHATAPTYEYDHSNSRCAVIGGYVYRGSAYPFMNATYIYADYCTGEVWGLGHIGPWVNALVYDHSASVTTFGEDRSGELYMADANGVIYAVQAAQR